MDFLDVSYINWTFRTLDVSHIRRFVHGPFVHTILKICASKNVWNELIGRFVHGFFGNRVVKLTWKET